MAEQDGLVDAWIFDGRGGGRAVDWQGVRSWTPQQGVLWVHLDRLGTEAERWLREESGVDPVLCETLLSHEVRPRVLRLDDALVVILRGVNLNPGADPEDMVGVRMWIERDRIITLRHRRVMAMGDIREALPAGRGPNGPGDFLARVSEGLIERIGPVIADLDEEVDGIEDALVTTASSELRAKLTRIRQTAIGLRRYLAPQRDVVARLPSEPASWLENLHKALLREVGDRTTRYVEDLDAIRERAAVLQDELASRVADQMNKTVYLLTVVAAILLPPSLLTGLLGINVSGMPGAESPVAFYFVVLMILVLGVFEVLVLRRLKWI
jgi:zinc transporter